MSNCFVHLRVHSEYSLADGLVKLDALARQCADFGQTAVALTDLANFYAVVKFYRSCMKFGVKPILGCDVFLQNPIQEDKSDRVLLLCIDNQGYRNLSKLLSNAYAESKTHNRVQINWKEFSQLNTGLICLFDEHQGPIANRLKNNDADSLDALIGVFKSLLQDRLYMSISRIGWAQEQEYIRQVAHLSVQHEIPLVATNRVQFVTSDQFDIHEIRVCINEGRILEDRLRPRNFTQQQYFRSSQEMQELFSDMPIAITNTVEVAKRCNVFFDFNQSHLPNYADGSGQPIHTILRTDTQKGLTSRLQRADAAGLKRSVESEKTYIDRMNMELGVIEEMGFSGYFLIVADFIRWAKDNDIPVGPGRGSGAGSVVAWAIGITELDPLEYGLLFERFLNPERISLPDFDIDFCVNGRDRVIEYVANRYGQDQVAQIVTFGTMAAKAVLRDVGRVLNFSYGFVDQLAKLIPTDLGITLEKSLEQEQLLRDRYEDEEEVKRLIDLGLQLEGTVRNIGKHAGGVVIAPKELTEYTPLYSDAHLDQAITQLDKDDLETMGLVKFDFLGLRTLTILDNALKMVNAQVEATDKIDLSCIPLDDEKTYQFICTGQTSGVFQLESRGMKELVIQVQPSRFEDLIALIALFRPGPLQSGMVEDFVNRKHGKEPIKYPHPKLESILNETNGVILYQEQVMKIAQVLSGYTLGFADVLRQAMGKKKLDEMASQRKVFVAGAKKNDIDEVLADNIFSLIEKFAGYGFNKSHSVAYALISYQTAWIKTHYCSAYMAATLSADMDDTNKVVFLIADCKSLGLEVRSPSVNTSFYSFKPIDDKNISYGLGAIKGIGESAIQTVIDEREKNGPYKNLFDLCQRNSVHTTGKRVLEALIKSGCLDSCDTNRAQMMADIPKITQATGQKQKDEEIGQIGLFDSTPNLDAESAIKKTKPVAEWTESQRLEAEKETLGLYLTGHPYNRYAAELDPSFGLNINQIDLSDPRTGIFAGIVLSLRAFNTRRGKMIIMTLDNGTHRVEATLFADNVDKYHSKVRKDSVLIVAGEMSLDEYSGGVRIRSEVVFTIDELRTLALKKINLKLDAHVLDTHGVKMLQDILAAHKGKVTMIHFQYVLESGEIGELKPSGQWRVSPDQNLIDKLQNYCGRDNISYYYDTGLVHQLVPEKRRFKPKSKLKPN